MPQSVADASFDRLADKIVQTVVELDPVGASWLGIHGANDSRLPNRSREACERELEVLGALLKDLLAVRDKDLSPDRLIDCRLARGALSAKTLRMHKHPPWKESPCFYIEPIANGMYNLVFRNFAPPAERERALLGRLRDIPPMLQAARANLENPPGIFTETAGLSIRGVMAFLSGSVAEFISSANDTALRTALEKASASARTALAVHQEWLETNLMPRSGGEFAVGRPTYQRLLAEEHFLSWNADDLIAVGQHVHHETMREMKRVASRIDPGKPWSIVVEDLKLSHPASGGLLKAYGSEMARARSFLVRNRLATVPPGESICILPTPEFARPIYPYAAYLAPAPFENDQSGIFWVTEPDPNADPLHQEAQLRGHARHRIPVTVLHETYPGHHLQHLHSRRVRGHRLRHVFRSNSYVEGWALYCEGMMYEQGFFTDDRVRLLQLKDLLWRTCRIIVDVQLHAGQMGFNEAVQFLVKKARLERTNAVAEVRRYCAHPTQPMSYLIGMIQIRELLEDYRNRAGEGFDLRMFHEELLSHGAIPVELLRGAMDTPRGEPLGNGRKRGHSPVDLVRSLNLLGTKDR